jgi:hypothetical protein
MICLSVGFQTGYLALRQLLTRSAMPRGRRFKTSVDPDVVGVVGIASGDTRAGVSVEVGWGVTLAAGWGMGDEKTKSSTTGNDSSGTLR